jgi:DNA-binding response OmpR family regulator
MHTILIIEHESLGANDYIVKPFVLADVRTKVDTWIDSYRILENN